MSGTSVVTRKGQVTIPADIRRALGIHEGDRVTFVIDNGTARLERVGSIVARTRGIFKTDQPPLSPEELREAAEWAIAADVAERMCQE